MFSIVTANWNGERMLSVFLKSLTNQTYKDFILYIVDNGSQDKSVDIINAYKNKINIRLIKLDHNSGFAKANNIGINEAMTDKNEYIITLNNDLELDKNCIAELKDKISNLNNKYDAFQILLVNFYDRNKIDAAGIYFDKYFSVRQIGNKQCIESLNEINNDIDGVCAGAAVYSKRCLKMVKSDEAGYFDSSFFAYYEDADLALRLLNTGFKSYLIKEAVAYHIHSGTSGKDTYFKSFYLSRNSRLYLKKNLSNEIYQRNKRIYFFNFIKTIIKQLIKVKFSAAYGTIKGYFDFRKLISIRKL